VNARQTVFAGAGLRLSLQFRQEICREFRGESKTLTRAGAACYTFVRFYEPLEPRRSCPLKGAPTRPCDAAMFFCNTGGVWWVSKSARKLSTPIMASAPSNA
jgi:hypothetical protein